MTVVLASQAQFFAAVDAAAEIRLSAYILAAGGAVASALERAADHGARVSVSLQGAPYGDPAASGPLARGNLRAASELRSHGVAVDVTTSAGLPLHMKAAVVDGTAFLDDRNWPSHGDDTLVATDDAADVAAVTSALDGKPLSTSHLATEKSRALALEARTIEAAAGDRIDVESESFGASAVSKALRLRALQGAHVRLIVAEREFAHSNAAEQAALARLAAAGVEIRVAREAEKVCVAGAQAWVGSANATFATAFRPVLDWGMQLDAPATIARLEADFTRTWQSAVPVSPAATPRQSLSE